MIFALGTKLLLALGVGDKLAKRFAWAPALILAALLVFLVMRIAANWFGQALDTAAEAGATAVIQPGGSMNDAQVIAAADEAGLAMVFTGMRHFRH